MSTFRRFNDLTGDRVSMKRLIVAFMLLVILVAAGIGLRQAAAAGTGPCDIYASGGTPCVAAHSTTRALYGAYSGRLYQIKRASNGGTTDVSTVSAGGVANAATQNSFCSGTTCTITIIYDQSGRGNHLTPAPAGGVCGADRPANASALSLTLGGSSVYGVYISQGVGYRRNSTSGIATGDQPEGMYAVMSGTRYNAGCCFDYGNAETNNLDTGNGHMEAIYLGNNTVWGHGSGSGPWVMADLENGLFAGGTLVNNNNGSVHLSYVTAMVKGQPNQFAIKAGNAQSGGLTTKYEGARPTTSGYNPMHKEGAIILGIGGDNSCSAIGNFYEGAMTTGYPSASTENSVQANIVAAGYSSPWSANRIVNRNSGKVLDVQQPNASPGANIGQWTANGNPWQDWQLVNLGNGYYNIVSSNSGLCIDVSGASTADGANVLQYTCNGGQNQQWQMVTTTAPYFRLVARHSGKVMDVENCGTADGVNVRQWTWLNNNCQQWSLQ